MLPLHSLLLLLLIHRRSRHPHCKVSNQHNPAERRGHVASDVRLPDAAAVRQYSAGVEQGRGGGDAKVDVGRPCAGVLGPCGAGDGLAVDDDGLVHVFGLLEFDERHDEGNEDADGDEEGDDAGDDTEAADARFEDLGVLVLIVVGYVGEV